ncbi:MAG: phosphoribosylamine--glycine ligase, partial [Deltaproteobacteria bacterium]|nr:phosphoribosylamine--glycine ligase [Deltaproteobacteria bacterium]
MKVLVIGSGGREHSLVWKLNQSQRVAKIYCAPGNAGIAGLAECVAIG